MTSEQIERALYLGPSTINSHMSSIYRKLDVGSRHRAILKVGVDNIDLAPIEESSEHDA